MAAEVFLLDCCNGFKTRITIELLCFLPAQVSVSKGNSVAGPRRK